MESDPQPPPPEDERSPTDTLYEDVMDISEDEQSGGVEIPPEAFDEPPGFDYPDTGSLPSIDVLLQSSVGLAALPPQPPLPTSTQALGNVAVPAQTSQIFGYSLPQTTLDDVVGDYHALPPWDIALAQPHNQSLVAGVGDDQPVVEDQQGHAFNVPKFFSRWRDHSAKLPDDERIGPEAKRVTVWERPATILPGDLQGDGCDIQGINWLKLETTREKARKMRPHFYRHPINRNHVQPSHYAECVPNGQNFFRFRRNNTSHRPHVCHFQLRNLIATNSRSDIYYAGKSQVLHTDTSGRDLTPVLGFANNPAESSTSFRVTCLTASDDALIAGGFQGQYALLNLATEFDTPATRGFVTQEWNGITNHVHTFRGRSNGRLHAAFSSNDCKLRILDCHTNRFIHAFPFPVAINCSATSPDRRLRVVVGDFGETLITEAETGKAVQSLRSHDDWAFACDWADDGIHIATGAQDNQIVIYDARRWDQPLRMLATEMGCARSLRFSPVGGGKRVLVAAEADDIVDVFDAGTFDRRQTLDFYGGIGGIDFTPDGSSLVVANTDPWFGGIMEFERIGHGAKHDTAKRRAAPPPTHWRDPWSHFHQVEPEAPPREDAPFDWIPSRALDGDGRVRLSYRARSRRGLGLGGLVV